MDSKKRISAFKTADAINAIKGNLISNYAQKLSESWAKGKITGGHERYPLFEHFYRKAGSIMFGNPCRFKGSRIFNLGCKLSETSQIR